MSEPLVLAEQQFARWARAGQVRLPYPVDITDVDAAGTPAPNPDPRLDRFAAVCAGARTAVFVVVIDPSGTTDVAVACAADRDASVVSSRGGMVTIASTRPSELVTSLIELLPRPAAMRVPSSTMAEQGWNELLQRVATDPPRVIGQFAERLQVPVEVVAAMLAGKDRPVRTGLLGAAASTSAGSPLQLGPAMGSWFEYPGGSVLATLHQPRHANARSVTVQGFELPAAARCLTDALSAAQRAVVVA